MFAQIATFLIDAVVSFFVFLLLAVGTMLLLWRPGSSVRRLRRRLRRL